MNALQFVFRFGKLMGIVHFAFIIGPIIFLLFLNTSLPILVGSIGILACGGFLWGATATAWGFYKEGPEYFTVQPEAMLERTTK
jgi:hypothetical protein